MKLATLVGIFALTCASSAVYAEERATTAQLPQALEMLGVSHADLLTPAQASQVRGSSGKLKLTPFLQIKTFKIEDGYAKGTTTLLEGVFSDFQYTDGQNLVVTGTVGGLAGHIGATNGVFEFAVAGKALRETVQFQGEFSQIFTQTFRK